MADDQQQQTVRRVVIVGDGVDGWMAAAGLACAYGPSHQITVVAERVEDDPALVADPGFTTWLGIIGLHPAELLRSAAATFAHGVALQGADQPIFVPFVDWAPDLDGVALYHYWLTARATQGAPPLPAYMLCAQLAAQGRVAQAIRKPPLPHRMGSIWIVVATLLCCAAWQSSRGFTV